jgi:nanoRNase/pAp phosphatase (c-di-AMP/oligoRNAs hydrolase)
MRALAKVHFVREEFASESELILRLVRELGVELTPEQAFLLLTGIVVDTGQFRLAKSKTFEAVNQLIKAGADYQRVVETLRLPEDFSKRVAMLKASQRLELHRISGRLIAFSELSSFEADAATMFLRMGADAAFVGSEEKSKFRLCSRARQELCRDTGLHLGELLGRLAKSFKGSGGGHAGAASMTGEGELAEIKKELLKELQRILK